MLSSIFVLSGLGTVLVEKHWRGLLPRSLVEQFAQAARASPKPEDLLPVMSLTGPASQVSCFHVFRGGMFFVGMCQTEQSPLLVLQFLHRVADVLKGYFDGVLGEAQMRENFVTVYQVLEEMADHGFPFTTEPNALEEIIPVPGLATTMASITGKSALRDRIGQGALSNTPWRRAGVKYTTNEIYLDIIETLDCTLEPNGQPAYAETLGEIQATCKLSGMPDLTLKFIGAQVVDDVSFHPCVRLARWEQNRTVSFVPPDGSFKLMDYRVKSNVDLPLSVNPQILFSKGSGRVTITVNQKGNRQVDNVIVSIPFPKSLLSPQLSPNCGVVSYNDKTKVFTWTIGTLPSDRTPQLDGTVQLKADAPAPESNPVLDVDFRVGGAVPSGLRVDSLELFGEHYKPYKGVKLVSKGGRFHVRS